MISDLKATRTVIVMWKHMFEDKRIWNAYIIYVAFKNICSDRFKFLFLRLLTPVDLDIIKKFSGTEWKWMWKPSKLCSILNEQKLKLVIRKSSPTWFLILNLNQAGIVLIFLLQKWISRWCEVGVKKSMMRRHVGVSTNGIWKTS